MNFLPATVEGNSVKLPFGSVEIPADKAAKAKGHGLLIAGIRPEHFEDASVVDSSRQGSTFRAKVDVVEWLGNEAFAYIPFEAPPEVQQQLAELEKDLEGESLRTQLVISLDGTSKVAEGDEAEIWVDTSKMHLFDPSTGENLTIDLPNAGRVPERMESTPA
jgi:multiple sugar transport system ATP-binding protein